MITYEMHGPIVYAYDNYYEPEECVNLLKSKGFSGVSASEVAEYYDMIYDARTN
jgi:hypothetical protein